MNKLKIAIVGVGNIAKSHIAGYLKNPSVELYAFCDIDEENLKEKGKTYGTKSFFVKADGSIAEDAYVEE